MKTKNVLAICIFTLFVVNLVYGRWPRVDPHAENYYPQSTYLFAGNDPINNTELDGRDWYRNEDGNMMWRRFQDDSYTDDGGVVWTNAGTSYLHQRKGGSAVYFTQNTNDDGTLSLSSHEFSRNEMAGFGLFHSEKAMMAAIDHHVNPNWSGYFEMVGKELAAQWTTPELVVGGLSAGVGGLQAVGQPRVNFGRNSNQVYHTFRHIDDLGISRASVQNAVHADLRQIAPSIRVGQTVNRVVSVDGESLQYTVYRLSSGELNIGRIHGK